MKQRIVIATGLYPPDIGGPATYVRMLEDELSSDEFELTVVPFGWVRRYPKLIRHAAYFWKLYRASRKTDVVFALDGVSVGVPALLVSRLRRKTFLVRLGGDYAWEQGRLRFGLTETLDEFSTKQTPRPFMVRVLAWLQTFVVARADRVIAPSEYLKSIIVTWGIAAETVTVIYSALFPLPISGTRESIRTQLEYEGLVLITAARLTPWKGIHGVIHVVKMLREKGVDTNLIIAGDGEAKTSLAELASEHGVSDYVRFVGKLSKEALGAAIYGADVFVYNTQYEGLPHQLLEVMQLGVPIVTTTIPGNQEVITHKQEGLLVEPNDSEAFVRAIERLQADISLRQSIITNAKNRSEDFAQATVTKKLITLLQSL